MKATKLTGGSVVAMTVAALLTSAASAQADPRTLPTAAHECRAAISKAYGKLSDTAVKTIASCHKARNKGTIALEVNCNDVTDPVVDAKGKFAATGDALEALVNAECAGLEDSLLNSFYYSSCAATCPEVVNNPLLTISDVGKCQVCTAAEVAGDAAEATLGSPATVLEGADAKCHGSIIKGFGKMMKAAVKESASCQNDAEELNGFATAEGCEDSDVKGKVEKARVKALEGLDKSCVGASFTNIDACGADLAATKTCSETAWADANDDQFQAIYELPTTLCPETIRTTILGGCSLSGESGQGNCLAGSHKTGTILSVGWTGFAHGVDIVDNYVLAGDVTCPGSEAGACGECTIDGVSTDSPQYEDFLRCRNAPWTKCTLPFQNDPLCPSSGACRYFLGPPLAVSAGGTPTCTLNRIDADLSGTVNPDDGTSSFTVGLRAVVHGGFMLTHPCPICRDDVTPQDGVTDGNCLGGVRDGEACDVQGFDLSFARPTNLASPNVGPSLDCPPATLNNYSGQGLAITLPLTTGTSTKTAQDLCDAGPIGSMCFCGACSHDPGLACETDDFCDLADDADDGNSSASCNGVNAGQGVNRKANNCTDSICTPSANPAILDRGTCENVSDEDRYCDGAVFANGNGVIPCTSEADCDSQTIMSANPDDWICAGNDCGSCTLAKQRSCFLSDEISVQGTPDKVTPILAGTFCLPPSSNGGINAASGSPGPGVVQTDTIVELRF
jgi:hypothetical protein